MVAAHCLASRVLLAGSMVVAQQNKHEEVGLRLQQSDAVIVCTIQLGHRQYMVIGLVIELGQQMLT